MRGKRQRQSETARASERESQGWSSHMHVCAGGTKCSRQRARASDRPVTESDTSVPVSSEQVVSVRAGVSKG